MKHQFVFWFVEMLISFWPTNSERKSTRIINLLYVSALTLSMKKNTPPLQKFNQNLESLRGYSALFVVICHIVTFNYLFNRFYVPRLIVELSPNGSMWVLVFFVLSGYVIAISNKVDSKSESIGLYLKKRFVRIYPIYFISLIVTLLVSTFNYSLFEIVMNFAMMQVLIVPPFIENGPAWSLHYEVLYYLLFIPVSFLRLNPVIVLFICLIIALGNYSFYPNLQTPIISSYLFGFVFWISGLCIAKFAIADSKSIDYKVLISVLFMMLSLSEILTRSGLTEVFDHLSFFIVHKHLLYPKIADTTKIIISYQSLVFLPFCICAVNVFSGKKFKHHKVLFVFLHIFIISGIVLTARDYFLLGKKSEHIFHFFISVGYYVISLIFPFLNFGFLTKISGAIIRFGAWLGSISYAMYIVHCPLIFAMGRVNFLNNNLSTFVLRFIIFMCVLIGLSYLLERALQPAIKKLVMGNPSL